MKKIKFELCAMAIASLFAVSCSQNEYSGNSNLTSRMDSVSYALGVNQGAMLGNDLANLPKLADDTTSINQEVFINAFIKAMKNDSLALQISKEDATVLLQEFFADLRQAEMDRMKAKAIRNKLSGDSILNANRSQEGVQVTESGLQFKVITMGTGAKPTAEDIVRVNYVGKLADGTVFDSSIERGRPAEFPVGGVIPGWTEALKMMPVGSKWELVIPSELAYGEQGAGELIEPNSVLFFEGELLDIIKK